MSIFCLRTGKTVSIYNINTFIIGQSKSNKQFRTKVSVCVPQYVRTGRDQSWIWFCGTCGIPAWTSSSTFFWISSSWSLSWARSFSRVTGSWNGTSDHMRPLTHPDKTLKQHAVIRVINPKKPWRDSLYSEIQLITASRGLLLI